MPMNQQFLNFYEQHTQEMSVSFDGEGIITHTNPATNRVLDYPDGMRGLHISEVFSGTFERTADGFATDLDFGPQEKPVMVYRKNRTCFYAKMWYLHAALAEREYICLMTDVSNEVYLEQKIVQVQQEAEEAAKVKSEFVANVTHELRTPVNGILGNTRILLEEIHDEELLKTLKLIERGCNDMHSIINNILDFSKLDAGKFTLENREFDFRAMIDYVKANHMPKIVEKGLQFFVTISPEVPERVISDELRIEQVLNNILSNACKFTSVGKVSLEILKTAKTQNRVELFFIVNDTGIGIDKKDQDKLFESFSQVDASISRQYGGTGLGLNISKQLVTLMGGSINVESEKGRGTSFTFSIWVEIPENEADEVSANVDEKLSHFLEDAPETDVLHVYGTEENKKELDDKMSKLVLAVEMDNWEKAEMFMNVIRELTEEAPHDIKSASLRLKMAVQKADYDKTMAAHKKLLDAVDGVENGDQSAAGE
ncbi:MAG: ATP-binding protein [Clostridiales bacterium]|nr:ATP-binding protein [Clostridiales bacterium]